MAEGHTLHTCRLCDEASQASQKQFVDSSLVLFSRLGQEVGEYREFLSQPNRGAGWLWCERWKKLCHHSRLMCVEKFDEIHPEKALWKESRDALKIIISSRE